MTVIRFPHRSSRKTYEEEFLRLCALRREIDAQLDQLVEMVDDFDDDEIDYDPVAVMMHAHNASRGG
ncbi:hypothetical protein ACFQU1_23570 [Chelatococcus sp. GCM10030263]|uniref:hypothetical protein n=1 Tax=Chelatococcus sp. GCM10030263 TaxID=3273387 RepID=UPI00360F8B29